MLFLIFINPKGGPLSNKSIPRLLRPINPSSLYFLCIIGWKAHDTIISRGRGSLPGNRIECDSSCLIVASPSCPRWWPQKNYFVDFREPENLLTPCLNEITTPYSSAACSDPDNMIARYQPHVPTIRLVVYGLLLDTSIFFDLL